MVDQAKPVSETGDRYEILLKGLLGSEWSEWFDDMAIAPDGRGNTLLRGVLSDQAALHGILERVRDLGLTLLSVNRVE